MRACRQVVGNKTKLRYSDNCTSGGSFPRKRESRVWVPAFAGTSGEGRELCPEPNVPTQAENFTLADLAQRVKERAKASADVSYTRKLLDKGVAHCAKKFGEEAVETVLAAVAEDRERVISEAADVLYHLVVLLEARGIAVTEVEAELAGRMSQSGLQEKASRPKD
jgi:phosphoribosyl-ATP pyrophosphohydrolase